jgi:hypothetical protein
LGTTSGAAAVVQEKWAARQATPQQAITPEQAFHTGLRLFPRDRLF